MKSIQSLIWLVISHIFAANMGRFSTLITGISIGLALFSCTEEPDCQDTRTPFARTQYYSLEEQRIEEIIIDSLWVEGGFAPVAVSDTTSFSNLLLDPNANQTTYYFWIEDQLDTLTLAYNSKMEVKSPECGPFQTFFDISVVSTSFDSVVTVHSIADSRLPNNVEIYR